MTDKGVSALRNVCSLFVRKLKGNDYTQRINRVLPHDIRMLGHCIVPASFDARFSCVFREYNYFFFAQNMNIQLIAESAKTFIGLHDFRNFCKKDDSVLRCDDEEQNFVRRIFSFRTQLVRKNTKYPKLSIYKCVIKGTAFLCNLV